MLPPSLRTFSKSLMLHCIVPSLVALEFSLQSFQTSALNWVVLPEMPLLTVPDLELQHAILQSLSSTASSFQDFQYCFLIVALCRCENNRTCVLNYSLLILRQLSADYYTLHVVSLDFHVLYFMSCDVTSYRSYCYLASHLGFGSVVNLCKYRYVHAYQNLSFWVS